MSGIKNIILETSTEELENLLSPFIREQFPNFIRTDYPKLVLFIKAYYEWMEQQGNAGYIISKMDTIFDVDANAEEFYDHFKKTYLASFPELFAVNADGKSPNKKTLLKKIRDFYGNKGTQSAYKFLFRILYDSDLELYYPKTDILKASDGQWIEPRSIKTTSNNAADLFGGKNGQIYQYSGTQLVASAFINSVVQYSFNGLPVTEFFITDINGTFSPDQTVVITKDGTEWRETTYSVLGGFFIELPGSGYRIGDTVTVTDSRGVGFAAKIEQTGLAGSIKKIGISNSGLNYSGDLLVNIFSEGGAQSAKVFALRSAVTNYVGYFSGNRGKVSSNKKIQDGHYYQDFSYELKSEVSLDTYFDTLKKIIHPAGMRMFGSVLVKKAIDNTVTSSAQATYSEIPVVGRYTPYAFRTFNDLRGGYFLPNQVRGATLQVWLSAYNLAGNTSTGITANWGEIINTATIGSDVGGRAVTTEDIWGINRWDSVVGGHQFLYSTAYPNSNVWLTPNLKAEAINTHASVDFRPIQYNFSGPSEYSRLVSTGLSGPTMGRLGLTLSASYFAVAKPRRLTTMNNFGANQTGNVLFGDRGAHRGIVFGVTGADLTVPKIAAFSWNTSSNISGIVANAGRTGEWKLISHTLTNQSGNSGPMSLFLDGVCLGTVSQAWSPAAGNATSALQIGQQRFDSLVGAFDGEIAEVLCYQGDVGVADRQKIEGYLAHKYGIAENLPSNHPYKNTVPGGSYGSGKWYGTTGDFYPNGYNPYIGSTAQVGVDGSTAPLGSQFLDSGLGYTYTVCDEFGVTAHNPTGSPLGGTAAWYADRESNLTPQGMNGLVLWLKPENIGVCGSVVNGASADVWTDASPQANHALPPTWDRWNGVAHITHTATTSTEWSRQVYDNTNPVTKIAFVFNGLCGGFTTGRLCMVGLNTASGVTTAVYYPGNWVYSRGPFGGDLTAPRRVYYANYNSVTVSEYVTEISSTIDGYDNSVFEMEYVEPNLIWRKDGIVKRIKFVGYGQTFYADSTFYMHPGDTSRPGTSVTITELSYKGTPVTPAFTASTGINVITYAGVTVDKLRPTLQTAGFGGATGISFNGGLVFAPASTYRGVTLGGVVGLGYTTGPGSSAAAMLTGQHLYLRKPLKITNDADIFVVYRTTRDGLSFGYGLLGSRNTNCDLSVSPSVRFDSVLFSRSYNEQDRTAAQQNSSYYTVLPNGSLMYPGASLPPAGVFGFRPCGDQTGVLQNSIVYDPHVSGACLGICVGEAIRDSSNKIEVFLNGDRGLNKSRSTGRRVASIVPPSADNWVTTKNLVYGFDAGSTSCIGSVSSGFSSDLLSGQEFTPTPYNVLKSGVDPNNFRSDPDAQGVGFTRVTQVADEPTLGADEVYKAVVSTNGNLYTSPQYGTNSWRDTTLTSTHWTFSMWIRKADGGVIPSNLNVYIYGLGSDGNQSQATIEDMGSGWYRVSRTKSAATDAEGNRTTVTLVGVTGLTPGETVYFGRLQLLPYNQGDIDGRAFRTSTNYPSWATLYGTIQANSLERQLNPWGHYDHVWRGENHSTIATSAAFNSNGGFNTGLVSVDSSKKYRYSVWINRKVLGDGSLYFGPNVGSYKSRKNGFDQTNPYFSTKTAGSDAYTGKQNTWVLAVGHIHPFGSATGADESTSGYYTVSGGGNTYAPISVAGEDNNYHDFIWGAAGIASTTLRVFLYGSNTPGTEALFYRPRIDLVDGNEPDIADLLANTPQTAYDIGPNGFTGRVYGKPQYRSDDGGYLVFNGKSNFVESGADALAGYYNKTYTFEAWVKPSDVSSALKMFGGMDGLPYFGTQGNAYFWSFSLSGVQKSYSYSVPYPIDTRWAQFVYTATHIPATTASAEKTRFQVYINGVSVWEQTLDGAEVLSSNTVGIGDRRFNRTTFDHLTRNGSDFSWIGGISNVRVYNRALTPEEITQNFNSLRGRFGL